MIQPRIKPKDGPAPDSWIQCPAATKTGSACRVEGEIARNGLCHVHDPDGRARQNIEDRKAERAAQPERLQCPARTKAGTPCPIPGEIARDGLCHVHDPGGKFRQNKQTKPSRKVKQRRREARAAQGLVSR